MKKCKYFFFIFSIELIEKTLLTISSILKNSDIQLYFEELNYLFYYLDYYVKVSYSKDNKLKEIVLKLLLFLMSYFYSQEDKVNENLHMIRNKFCHLLFDKELYEEVDLESIDLLFSNFYICLTENPKGLLNDFYFEKLLNFSFLLNVDSQNSSDYEAKNPKKKSFNYLKLVEDFIILAFKENKTRIIVNLFNFLFDKADEKSDYKSNSYLLHSFLSIIYTLNQRNMLIETLEKSGNLLENFYNLLLRAIEKESENKDIEPTCDDEILKAISIRFIDEYFIRIERKRNSNKPKPYNNFVNNLKKETSTKSIQSVASEYTYTFIRELNYNIKSKESLRSYFLTMFETEKIDPKDALNYIQFEKQITFNFYNKSKDALEKIINLKITDKLLLEYYYEKMKDFLLGNIINNYIRLGEKDNEKRMYKEILESDKIFTTLFMNFIPIRTDTKELLDSVISITINKHNSPFYFNLIIPHCLKPSNNFKVIEFIENILICIEKEILTSKEKEYYNCIVNLTNLIIILYKMTFMKQNQICIEELQQNYKFFDKLIQMLIIDDSILYTQSKFITVTDGKNSNNYVKTILEMVIEILIELYEKSKQKDYLQMLETILYKYDNKSESQISIFYHVDNPLNKVKVFNLDSNVFKSAINTFNYATYYYFIKFLILMKNDKSEDLQSTYSNILKRIADDMIMLIISIEKNKNNWRNININHNNKINIENELLHKEIKNIFDNIKVLNDDEDRKNLYDKAMQAISIKSENLLSTYKHLEYDAHNDCFGYSNNYTSALTPYKAKKSLSKKGTSSAKSLPSVNSEGDIQTAISTEQNLNDVNQDLLSKFNYVDIKGIPTEFSSGSKKEDAISIYSTKTKNIIEEEKDVLRFDCLFVKKPKNDLLLGTFSLFFKDSYFQNNNLFDKVKLSYEKLLTTEHYTTEYKVYHNNFVRHNYPVKVRNMFTENYMRPFIKPDTKFFITKNFDISNDYYKNQNQNQNQKFTAPTEENELQVYKQTSLEFDLTPEDEEPENNYRKESNFINLLPLNFESSKKKNDEYKCELITLEGVIYGSFYIENDYAGFTSKINHNSSLSDIEDTFKYTQSIDTVLSSLETDIICKIKTIRFLLKDIKEIIIRRFLYSWQGCEIFLKNGKSYYFNFFNENKAQILLKEFEVKSNQRYLVIKNSEKYFSKSSLTKKWTSGSISNFDYLLYLNKYSSRSFHDPNQYPVFPWVISNYENNKLDINNKEILRNMSYPVSVQTDEKRLRAIRKYEDDLEEKYTMHFRCHYSTSAFLYYYLSRLSPFSQNLIKLQGGKFEHPNRFFYSIFEACEIILTNFNFDNRELIPEFFYLPEAFINLNFFNFGIRADKKRIDDLVLPEWSNNIFNFIYKHYSILNSSKITENLSSWIDLIFGYNQLVKTKESLNVYPKYCYKQQVDLVKKIQKLKSKLKKEEVVTKIKNKKQIILNFGQTPNKIFDDKHPKIEIKSKEQITDEFTFVSDLIRASNKIKKDKIRGDIRIFGFSKSYIYVLNGKYELEVFDIEKYNKRAKIVLIKPILEFDNFLIGFQNYKIYRDNYSFVELLDCKIFIFCRNTDRSIKIYYDDGKIKEILCSSFACSIIKSKCEKFVYTGHADGKIIKWQIDTSGINNKTPNTCIKMTRVSTIIAHKESVNCMLVDEKMGIFISGGEDGFIMIRNLYDFELLNCFKPDTQSYKIVHLALLSNLGYIYLTIYSENKFILMAYTINGTKIDEISGLFNNVEVTDLGVLYAEYNINKITLVHHVELKKILLENPLEENEGLVFSDTMGYFSYNKADGLVNAGYTSGKLKGVSLLKDTEQEEQLNLKKFE